MITGWLGHPDAAGILKGDFGSFDLFV
jgi:hypothetical protein